MKEKQIEGYSSYSISEDGVVKNKHGKVLKGSIGSKGEHQIVLMGDDGIRRTLIMSRLLALSFIPNPNSKPCVKHKDGNKLNNSLDNLQWDDLKIIVSETQKKRRNIYENNNTDTSSSI